MFERIVRFTVPLVLLSAILSMPAAAQGFPPDSFTNLRVLPKDIGSRELTRMMANFTRALGIRCSSCHVGEESQTLAEYDFASDDKLLKRKTREMIRMTQTINGQHLAGLESRVSPSVTVECFTCHRGTREPRTLQATLIAAYDAAGIDSLLSAYRSLRERYYGRAVFDFGEVALVDAGSAIVERGNHEDAERVYALNVEMNPASRFSRSVHARSVLANAFRRSVADGHTALRNLDSIYSRDAMDEAMINSLGYVLLGERRLLAAIEVFRVNVERHPDSWNAHDSLGEAYAANGNVEDAIRHYERSLELNPENEGARARLRELRGRTSQPASEMRSASRSIR